MSIQEQQGLCFYEMQLEHIPYVLHIEGESYPDPWTYNMFRQELDNHSGYFCVLFADEILAGYGGFWMLVDEAHITRVTVRDTLRGQGLSRHIMRHLLEEAQARNARQVRLEVREGNLPAIALYTGLGFIEEGRRTGYYQSTKENAICMVKPLSTRNGAT